MKVTAYLHSTKEDMLLRGEEAGLTGDALDNFMYALYEVRFDIDVDERTGNAEIVAVDGRTLVDASTVALDVAMLENPIAPSNHHEDDL